MEFEKRSFCTKKSLKNTSKISQKNQQKASNTAQHLVFPNINAHNMQTAYRIFTKHLFIIPSCFYF